MRRKENAYKIVEQTESDIETAASAVEQAKKTVTELQADLDKLLKQHEKSEVSNVYNRQSSSMFSYSLSFLRLNMPKLNGRSKRSVRP